MIIKEQEWMINMEDIFFSTNVIATIFYLSVALISIVMYDKANSNYNKNKSKIYSFKSFMYIYKIMQLSTLFICITSIWMDHIYLYKLFNNTETLKYIGISISGFGITIFSIARFTLGKNYSPCYDSYIPKSINTKGIYSIIRHPIYTANLLLMIGIFISSGSAIIALNAIILFLYYAMSAFVEEKAIEKKFPTYATYKNKTGMFFPSIIKGIIS